MDLNNLSMFGPGGDAANYILRLLRPAAAQTRASTPQQGGPLAGAPGPTPAYMPGEAPTQSPMSAAFAQGSPQAGAPSLPPAPAPATAAPVAPVAPMSLAPSNPGPTTPPATAPFLGNGWGGAGPGGVTAPVGGAMSGNALQNFVNAMRGSDAASIQRTTQAAQPQQQKSQTGLLPKLFSDIGSLSSLFGGGGGPSVSDSAIY